MKINFEVYIHDSNVLVENLLASEEQVVYHLLNSSREKKV